MKGNKVTLHDSADKEQMLYHFPYKFCLTHTKYLSEFKK